MNVQAVSEEQEVALAEVVVDALSVDLRSEFVRYENHDNLRSLDSVSDSEDFKAVFLGSFGRRAGLLVQANDDIDAAVAQVLCVRVTLATVTDDGDGLLLMGVILAVLP